MSSFEVSPSGLHAVADDTGGSAYQMSRAAGDLSAIDPRNPGFSLSSSISTVAAGWSRDLAAAAEQAADVSDRLHATATVYQHTEAANEAAGAQLRHLLGGDRS